MTDNKAPREFWYSRSDMESRSLEYEHSMFETRWYPEEEYDKLQSRLEKCEAIIRWIKEQKEYFEAKPHKMLGDIYNHPYFAEVEGE